MGGSGGVSFHEISLLSHLSRVCLMILRGWGLLFSHLFTPQLALFPSPAYISSNEDADPGFIDSMRRMGRSVAFWWWWRSALGQ